MARFLAHKVLGSLKPVDANGEDVLRKLSSRDVVMIEVKRPRNSKMHRLYWALVTLVWENMDGNRYPTPDDLHAAFKIAAGIRTRIELPNGEIGFIPGSIAFHKMDQAAFDAFYDRICDLVCKHFLPGVDNAELRAEVESMVGLRVAA